MRVAQRISHHPRWCLESMSHCINATQFSESLGRASWSRQRGLIDGGGVDAADGAGGGGYDGRSSSRRSIVRLLAAPGPMSPRVVAAAARI
jgi:hypothetical protein